MRYREEKGVVGRVVGALSHGPDNVSATLPDFIRDRVTSKDRRESVENATAAGARASNFRLPRAAANVVEDRVQQAKEETAHNGRGSVSGAQVRNIHSLNILCQAHRCGTFIAPYRSLGRHGVCNKIHSCSDGLQSLCDGVLLPLQ